MKTFFKIVFLICLCVSIFVFSGIRLKYIDKDVRNNKYNSMAVKKIFNEVKKEENNVEETNNVEQNTTDDENAVVLLNVQDPIKIKQKLNDWRLVLVNYDHELPENFTIELANIDKTRQFDKRAIDELNAMLLAAKKAKVGDLWAQSAYRSVERQEELFSKKVKEYMSYGKTEEEAQMLTRQYINESNTSEHNLGLAVDFNYINNDFEKTKVFTWLIENAENYGFVLRYRKDKEEITKVSYEPWHWRYVGQEHATAMNELDMCLEEYIQYLEDN